MTEIGLTLEDISIRSGVEPRTLRSWISEGLLAPPFRPGRGARYPESNATRALAVRALKDIHGQSLSEIRKHLMLADESQVVSWAAEVPTSGRPISTAREYLSQIQNRAGGFSGSQRSATNRQPTRQSLSADQGTPGTIDSTDQYDFQQPDMFEEQPDASLNWARGRDTAELANIERILAALEVEVRSLPPRKSHAQFWNRIGVTPEIEISVKGKLSPRERAMFERMADLIRTILTTGGATNDQLK